MPKAEIISTQMLARASYSDNQIKFNRLIPDMPPSYERDLHSETDYLKQASIYVGLSQLEDAIALLERARLRIPVTNRLINALGKLYLTVGKSAQAAECFKIVLNRKSKVETEVKGEFPLAEDMQYLEEQSHLLIEKEYSFESQDEPQKDNLRSKDISVRWKKSISDKRIFFKNSLPINIKKKLTDIRAAPSVATSDSSQSFDSAASDDELADIDHSLYQEYLLTEENDEFSTDTVELDGEQEEHFADGYGISSVDELDIGPIDVVVAVPELIEDIDCELSELPYLADNFFLATDVYDHWPDDFFDEDVEDDLYTGVLGDRISREQRAQQAAVACLEVIGWNNKSLSFVTDVFIALGWNNARKALEREALTGATYEELNLAFDIKQIWAECDRYWISFTGAWLPGETTSATYRHCSWRQALRLIRVFNGIPSSEEVWDLVESEFEFWYGNSLLRARFPAFSKYLFNYRLNESLPTISTSDQRRFDLNIAFDEMNASWSYHLQSDEYRLLSEYGIDVINRYAPKSYYLSDVDLDLRSLDKPKPQKMSMETVFDDEKS